MESFSDPPSVLTLAQQITIEHEDLSVTCKAIPGNPNYTTFYWTNLNNPGFKQNFSELRLPHIQRNSSGTYRCTAENTYSNREKGTNNKYMVVNVLCKWEFILDYEKIFLHTI